MITAPCENASKYVLPALRVNIAKLLAKNGFTQKEIANILGVAQPAVSKYLSNGFDRELKILIENEKVKKCVDEIYQRILEGKRQEDIKRILIEKTAELIKDKIV